MKNVKGQLTKRDINLIEYCLAHLPINSDIAAALFYPNKYIAQRRLTTIHNLKQLKRTERLVVNQPYIYYSDKKDLKIIHSVSYFMIFGPMVLKSKLITLKMSFSRRQSTRRMNHIKLMQRCKTSHKSINVSRSSKKHPMGVFLLFA